MRSIYLIVVLLTVSCTVTKRVHQPGYSVQWKGKYTENEQTDTQQKKTEIAVTDVQTEKETIRIAKIEEADKVNVDHKKPNKLIDKLSETVNDYIPTDRYEESEMETEYEATDGIDENQSQRTTQRTFTNYSEESKETTQNTSEDENAPAGRYATTSMIMGLVSFALVVSGILLVVLYSPWAYILVIPIFVISLLAFIFGMKSRSREVASKPNLRRRRIGIILGLIDLGALAILAVSLVVYVFYLLSQWWIY